MAPFPDWVEPMAATLTQARFIGPEWIFERKVDGIRLLAFRDGDGVRLLSRNRLLQRCPSVAEQVAEVAFIEWTVHGKLRHARLTGLVEGKPARAVARTT